MYGFIYQKWWKILTLLMLLYVFIAGFLVPLRPGILEVSESRVVGGDSLQVFVTTYNTQWQEGDLIQAFIKYDSVHIWSVPGVTLQRRNKLLLQGRLLGWRSNSRDQYVDATLILHHPRDGFMVMPSAFTITAGSGELEAPIWVEQLPQRAAWSWKFPFRSILYETIRNTFFHVAIWMAMFVLLVVSLVYSIKYLLNPRLEYDAITSSFAHVAIVWGTMGMITGSLWARATWGTFWTNDPKLNMSAVAMMIYVAYAILRASINDDDRRAQLSSAYNIFAFMAMIPLVIIIPRLTSSLHPGNGGNPALGGEDLDHTLRLIFYPAVIGYTLLGVWMASLLYRLRRIEIRNLIASLQD